MGSFLQFRGLPRRSCSDAGIDSALPFGVRIGQNKIGQDKPIDAHACLNVAGVEVTGYPAANTYAEIACFV